MKRVSVVVLVAVALVGCAGSSEVPRNTTTADIHAATVAPPAVTTPPDTTTTSIGRSFEKRTESEDRADSGGEAITVTEKVTITVTDPED